MSNKASEVSGERRKQYVTFNLDKEEYGIEINKSKEIIKPTKITPVPNTAEYILGVINLRGQIIPTIDLGKKLGLKSKEMDENKRIMIINFEGIQIGFLVDGVNEVVWLEESELEPPPEKVDMISEEYLKGVGKRDARLIIVLDIGKLLEDDNRKERGNEG